MIPFDLFCPEIARTETRAIVVPEGDPELPAGTYAFMELYCGERGCRCDNVMLNVCDVKGAHLATINHSLSPGGFADLGVRDTFLDPLTPRAVSRTHSSHSSVATRRARSTPVSFAVTARWSWRS